ncbi:hypothetical protein VTN02DRAFT_1212 [Thermoascus thermophilus]
MQRRCSSGVDIEEKTRPRLEARSSGFPPDGRAGDMADGARPRGIPLRLEVSARLPDAPLFRIRTARGSSLFARLHLDSNSIFSPVFALEIVQPPRPRLSSPASMPLRPASASLLGRLSQVALRDSSSSSNLLLPRAASSSAASALVLPPSSLIARSSPPHRCHQQQQQQQLRPYSSRPSSSPSPHNNRSQFKVLPFIILIAVGSGAYVLLVKSRTAARQQQQQQLEQQ